MQATKTIILGSKNKKEQAILNLRYSAESEIKFFNFNNKNKNFALGIKQGGEVKKIPLTIKNNLCKFSLPKNLDLQKNILCAVVDVSNAFCPEIVLSGSNNTTIENSTIEEYFVTKKPKDTSVLYTQDSLEEINNLIEKNLQDDLNCTYYDNCSNCKYREAFYNVESANNNNSTNVQNESIKKTDSLNIEEISKEDALNKEENFYFQIKQQIDALFNKYPEYTILTKIVSNSKWVKINYDDGEEFYVLGLIYDKDSKFVEFISYGVPSQDDKNPPEDIKDFAQWLPIENLENNLIGFWLVYQNASNGEAVKVEYK